MPSAGSVGSSPGNVGHLAPSLPPEADFSERCGACGACAQVPAALPYAVALRPSRSTVDRLRLAAWAVQEAEQRVRTSLRRRSSKLRLSGVILLSAAADDGWDAWNRCSPPYFVKCLEPMFSSLLHWQWVGGGGPHPLHVHAGGGTRQRALRGRCHRSGDAGLFAYHGDIARGIEEEGFEPH